jgi:glycerate 2-kinase
MMEPRLSELRRISRALFSKALSAVDPAERIRDVLRVEGEDLILKEGEREERFDLRAFERILLIGAGKASTAMAQSVEEILGERLSLGIVATKHGHAVPLRKTETIEAGHPVPDEHGLEAATKIEALLCGSGPKDLVIFLLSGGGSALLPYPADQITLEEKQSLTQRLLDSGMDIQAINSVRKHISRIKGGGLARWAYPSTVLALLLSDVVGDRTDVIGSGPTVPDRSTFSEALGSLRGYGLLDEIPLSIRRYLEAGAEARVEETPKPGDPTFGRVYNTIIGSNLLALRAAAREADSMGFHALILSSSIVGEARDAARFHTAIAKEVFLSGNPVPRPACIVSGGETTVTLKKHGLGGRNQEFALSAALDIDGLGNVVILSGGTDGTDGPTDAAGAIADSRTIQRARQRGLDPERYLDEHDAYPFFKGLGDLLMTGPTNTNVMDLRIMLVD